MSAWSLAMNLSMAEHRAVSIFLVTAGVNKASDGAEQKGIPQQGAGATSPGDGLQDLAADGPRTDGTDGQGKPASSPLAPLKSSGSTISPPPPGDHEGSQGPLGPQGRTLLSSRSVSWNAEPKPRCCLNAPAKVTPSSSVSHTNNGLTLLSHPTLGRGSQGGTMPSPGGTPGSGRPPSAGGGGPALVESARLSHRCFAQFLRTEHECPPDATPVQTQCARDAVVPSSLS
ncbi:hypothetical protein J1605_012998 [Eschrichtius robustus]|uniref:Uncharacterized protein n=1 Tax=Eschrichtius robustus TaxID=9764 RepID=A0AB34GFX5_ESCRO|nr:hypothetical protein J1605_012998 [Eschrichtius robustus]